MSLSARLQVASRDYQKLQAELQTAVEARQKLDAQLQENELVKKEFASLTEENTIYKMIGPVLVPQEQSDAKQNVDTRIDYISSELKRVDVSIKEIEANSTKIKNELVEIQTAMQKQEQQDASQGSASAIAA